MVQKLKIWFVDFWGGFDVYDNIFVHSLKLANFDPVVDRNCDLLFFSVFGSSHKTFSCKKIFYTGENVPSSRYDWDLALTFEKTLDPRVFRLPLYVFQNYNLHSIKWIDSLDLRFNEKTLTKEKLLGSKFNFCSFIQSNGNCLHRNSFFEKLSNYKRVDSWGPFMNNMGKILPWSREKIDLLSKYKFHIAFENTSSDGYVTEKILEPMMANTIPIYWGSPSVDQEFNDKSFVNAHSFSSLDDLVDRVKELNENDDAYYDMYKQSYFKEISETNLKMMNLADFFKRNI